MLLVERVRNVNVVLTEQLAIVRDLCCARVVVRPNRRLLGAGLIVVRIRDRVWMVLRVIRFHYERRLCPPINEVVVEVGARPLHLDDSLHRAFEVVVVPRGLNRVWPLAVLRIEPDGGALSVLSRVVLTERSGVVCVEPCIDVGLQPEAAPVDRET